MLNPIDWQQVVHDPGFWSLRYNGRFPGVTDEEGLAYFYAFYHLTEDEDELTEEEAEQVGWCRLSLSFPRCHYLCRLAGGAPEPGIRLAGDRGVRCQQH